jgi:hypothetical protein
MENQPSLQAEAPASGHDVWDEARIEQAMEKLQLAHIKVRERLRGTIQGADTDGSGFGSGTPAEGRDT